MVPNGVVRIIWSWKTTTVQTTCSMSLTLLSSLSRLTYVCSVEMISLTTNNSFSWTSTFSRYTKHLICSLGPELSTAETIESFLCINNQGCVRGQLGRGQGQGHKILSSRSRPGLEDPHPWAFYRVMLHRERLCHIVCLLIVIIKIQRPTAASCACVWSIVLMVLSPLLTNHTQKFNVLRPYLEAKAKAAHRRGQGQGHKILSSRCPRGRGQSSRTPSL